MDTAEITKEALAVLHAVIDPLVDAGKATLRWEKDRKIETAVVTLNDSLPLRRASMKALRAYPCRRGCGSVGEVLVYGHD